MKRVFITVLAILVTVLLASCSIIPEENSISENYLEENNTTVNDSKDDTTSDNNSKKDKSSGNFKYVTLDDGSAEIIGYTGSDSEISIPSEIDGYTVTSIGYGAFRDNKSITSVTIPDTVTIIKESAFNFCSGLTGVEIPDSVVEMGDSAFSKCSSLTTVSFGSSLKSIGSMWTFAACSSLKEFKVSEKNNYFSSIDGNLYDKKGETLIQYALGKPETSFVIPDSVTGIADDAFSDCSQLASITFSDSLESIGGDALDGTAWYESQPDGIVYAGKVIYAAKGENTAPSELDIKDGILGIAEGAFWRCSGITKVKIPASVKSIGDWAFAYCFDLKEYTVDKGNTKYCSIDGNLYDKQAKNMIQYAIGKTNESFTVPDTVTTIGELSFAGCQDLSTLTFSKSVKTINFSAFSECEGLTSLIIPDTVEKIGRNSFEKCNGLKTVTIGSSLEGSDYKTIIDGTAFYECKSLTTVVIGGSVTSIGHAAFECDESLTSVKIGNSLTSIGSDAFKFCYSLTSISIPKSVTKIDENAFFSCGMGFKIEGYKGSAAEAYAKENDITFIETE